MLHFFPQLLDSLLVLKACDDKQNCRTCVLHVFLFNIFSFETSDAFDGQTST